MLRLGLIYSYHPNAVVYRCPDDQTTHVRSYSMQPQMAFYPPMYKDNQMGRLSASQSLVFLDDDPTSINDQMIGIFITGNRWWDYPAHWHSLGCNMSFANRHAEHWKWMDGRTLNLASGMTTANNRICNGCKFRLAMPIDQLEPTRGTPKRNSRLISNQRFNLQRKNRNIQKSPCCR